MRYFSRSFISLLVIAGLLSGVVLVAPPAAAVSTVWTSTSDFDAGTKQDGTEFFTNVGVAQPMYSLISAPSTWYANGKTYVVFLGTASVPSSTYLVYITSYDHASGAWATPISIATGSIVADDHSAPSLFIDPSGFLHVFYGAHDSSIEYIKSTNPYDTSSWTTMADPESGTATYPSPFSYSSNIWLRYREGGGSTFDDWGYRTSADGGSTWSGLTVFLRVGGTDGTYLSAPEIWTDRFYFVFSRLVSGVRHNLYLCYLDLDTGDNFDMAGTNLGPLVDSAEAEANCLISNTGTSQVWGIVARADPATGVPYIVYTEGSSSTWRLNFTRWNGAAWTAPITIFTTDAGQNYADMIVTSGTDIEGFFVNTGYPGTTGGGTSGGGDMERWHFDGSWSYQGTLMSEGRSRKPLNLPAVPINHQDDLRIVFSEVGAPTNNPHPLWTYNLKLYAWGSGGLVVNDDFTSGNPWVETATDNSLSVSAGDLRLGTVYTDTFATAVTGADSWKWNSFSRRTITDVAAVCNPLDIASGLIQNTITYDAGMECGVSSAFSVSGDFDVRIKADVITAGSNYQRNLCIYDRGSVCSTTAGVLPTDTDGLFYRYLTASSIAAFNVSGGVLTQVGTTTTATVDPVWLRITRIVTTFTFFYSSDGSVWTQDEQLTRGDAPSVFYVTFAQVINGVTDGRTDFDDFSLSGTVNSPGGYRTSGSWTSPAIAADWDEAVTSITLQHSNLTADTPIDKIEVLRDFQVIETYDTNLTSGSETTLSFNAAGGGYMQVRVTLAGNGSASPTLESVQMTIGARDVTAELVELLLWLFLWIATVVLAFVSQPIFGIVSGIFGSFAAYDVFTLTGNLPLSLGVLMIALPLMAFSFGEFYKKMTQSEESGTGG